MRKIVSSFVICGVLSVGSLSAAEFQQDMESNIPSVLFGHEVQQQDLLSAVSAGALTNTSAGLVQLNAFEMQEVQGGSRIGKAFRKNKTRIKYAVFSGALTAVTGGSGGLILVHTAAGAATKKVYF